MAMRQFAQELQNIQQSQDHTISWMRDRIEQLTDGPRGEYTRDLVLLLSMLLIFRFLHTYEYFSTVTPI